MCQQLLVPFEFLYNLSMTCLKCSIIMFYFRYVTGLFYILNSPDKLILESNSSISSSLKTVSSSYFMSVLCSEQHADLSLLIVSSAAIKKLWSTGKQSYTPPLSGPSYQSSWSAQSADHSLTLGTRINPDRAGTGTLCILLTGLETWLLTLHVLYFRSLPSGNSNSLQPKRSVF
jgi:hypothetical protein